MANPSLSLTAFSLALILVLLLCGDEIDGSGHSIGGPLGLPLPLASNHGIVDPAMVGPPPWAGSFPSHPLWTRRDFVASSTPWWWPDLSQSPGRLHRYPWDSGAIKSPDFEGFNSKINITDGGAVLLVRADTIAGLTMLSMAATIVVSDGLMQAREHGENWVSKSFWAQIRALLSVTPMREAARLPWFFSWLGSWSTSILMTANSGELLGFVVGGSFGLLTGPCALMMDVGPGSYGSKMTSGCLYPCFS